MTKLAKTLSLTFFVCFVAISAMGQKSGVKQQGAPVDGAKLLELGDYYYRSNDTSDAADRYYQQAIRSSPGSQTAGYAQYNRANYWFRKFYVTQEQYSKPDHSALSQAERHYYDFLDKFAKQTNTVGLVADAEFNLALVYLQQGKRDYAVGWLNHLGAEAAKRDQSIYIYKVVWSSKPGDVVDRNVDAAQLANYARQLIEKGAGTDAVILDIKRWCQKQ